MKRLLVYLVLILPALLLALYTAFPGADVTLAEPLFHFYIVTFSTFAATVLSLFITFSVGQSALARHLFLAMAFVWMGAVFFIHGVATPGALITEFHPAVVWSGWLTLFGGGALFLIGGFAPPTPERRVIGGVGAVALAAYVGYVAVVVWAPGWLAYLLSPAVTPQARDVAFGLTLAIWLLSAARHYWNHRLTQHPIDALMAFEAGWFAIASVSLFRFQLWHSSWWLYHALLLIGFLLAVYILWRAYEQLRLFRLARYYLATSLIVTAALALLSAQLYANLAFTRARQHIEDSTALLSQDLATDVAGAAEAQTPADLSRLKTSTLALNDRLIQLAPLKALTVFDPPGQAVLSTTPIDPRYRPLTELAEEGRALLAQALTGQPARRWHAPEDPPPAYLAEGGQYVLETYVPVRPAQSLSTDAIGVLVTVREAPDLLDELIRARLIGLALAAVTLGGLFAALFVIVRRADRLILQRSRELEQAYHDLQRAEALRNDLTRMIVHDLRNPLTAVTANLDLMNKVNAQPEQAIFMRRLIAGARGSGQRMIGLIDDLLNVSKFEAGELRPVRAPVYLPGLLAERAPAYQAQAEREQKTFTLRLPLEAPEVLAEASLIGRTIDNLVSNAFKYTDAGGHVEVGLELRANELLVYVRDDGEGVPPEFLTRIFDKYVQATDKQGRSLRKGTGLGLTFCRMAVEAHGGRIWVESQRQQGSTFFFTLPL